VIDQRDRYRLALDWLNDRQTLGIEPGLTRIEALLNALGSPEKGFSSVHVAGTNGKGSVATLIAAALTGSGHRTGLYTSPHLVTFTERIQIDGEPIGTGEVADLVAELQDVVATLDTAGVFSTFFELCTAMAFLHFHRVGIDWAVVEAGMGGGLDATNVIDPSLTVITNVARDHVSFLGADIAEIASEKAGIIKPGVPLVSAARGRALEVIEAKARALDAPLTTVADREDHRLENEAVAAAACAVLRGSGVDVPEETVRSALTTTPLPGRAESVTEDGIEVLLDGAHNVAAARALGSLLESSGQRWDLVCGFASDKDWEAMLDEWLPYTAHIWAVPIRSPRTLDPARVAAYLDGAADLAASFSEAWEGVQASGARRMVVAGSLFLVGEAKAVLAGHSLEEVGGLQ
jgi:dihydrofolate synthase / folylpolyglutamate synthase